MLVRSDGALIRIYNIRLSLNRAHDIPSASDIAIGFPITMAQIQVLIADLCHGGVDGTDVIDYDCVGVGTCSLLLSLLLVESLLGWDGMRR